MIHSSQCAGCSHLHASRSEKTCDAFPQGIPKIILWGGEFDHRLPYPGDNGIRFEPRSVAAAARQERMFAPLKMASDQP